MYIKIYIYIYIDGSNINRLIGLDNSEQCGAEKPAIKGLL